MTFDWHPEGRTPYVRVKKTRKPPAKALFKDPKTRELVAKAKESAPIIGFGAGGRIVSVDLDDQSPHILVNASTGGGKSVTLRCIACQMLHHGSRVFVLDTKRISHPWARGLPGVTYCADIADIHDQLIALGMEGRRRTRVADDLGIDADPKAIGPRLLILLEEVNATMKQLARYWEKVRESGDPKVSPAVDALNEILYMGRQLRMHVLLVAQVRDRPRPGRPGGPRAVLHPHPGPLQRQRLEDARPGGPPGAEGRQAPRSRPGRQRRLRQRDADPVLHRGRSPSVGHRREAGRSGRPERCGAAAEAARRRPRRRLARPRLPPATEPSVSRDLLADAWSLTPAPADDPGDPVGSTTATPPPAVPAPADDDQEVGLRAAFENHLPGVASLDALRTARASDRTFPQPVGKRGVELLYRVGDLKRWARNRPRAVTGTTDLD